MTKLKVSDPSASGRVAVRLSAIGVSSNPLAPMTSMTGASATARNVTRRSSGWLSAALPLGSAEMAETFRVKSLSECAGGVMVRPFTCAGSTSTEPSAPRVSTTPPARTTAPSGIPAILKPTIFSEPSRSVVQAAMFSGIAVSSSPTEWLTRRPGASATASTFTWKDSSVLALLPFEPSVAVARIFRSSVPEKSTGGLRDTCGRSSVRTSQEPSD